MQGTEKQIKWATDIRDRIAAALPDMSSNPVANKAKQYLLGIDDADFWIEVANPIMVDGDDKGAAFFLLRELTSRRGLAIQGMGYSTRAKMDPKTGEITVC